MVVKKNYGSLADFADDLLFQDSGWIFEYFMVIVEL